MTTFVELQAAAPNIASFAAERIESTGLCMIATTRSDGWPRVSPMELTIHDGRIYIGSMPNAVKAQDLRRDPRCCIVTTLADKDDLAGEVKLFCLAREITEDDEWQSLRARWKELNDLDIGDPGDAHMFELGIEAAAWQRVEGDDWRTTSWSADDDRVRERVRTGPTGESRDL